MDTSERNDFYVYALLRPNGNIFYVGKGSGKRITEHGLRCDKSNPFKNRIIAKIRASGMEPLRVFLAKGLTEAQAFAREKFTIMSIGRHPSGPLANLTNGGEGVCGHKHSEATRQKLRISHTGYVHTPEQTRKIALANKGRKHTPEAIAKIKTAREKAAPPSLEARAKMSAARKGKPLTEETRAKLRIIHRTRPRKPLTEEHKANLSRVRKGRVLSLETRAKLSASKKGRPHSAAHAAAIAAALRGRRNGPHSEEHRKKIGDSLRNFYSTNGNQLTIDFSEGTTQ